MLAYLTLILAFALVLLLTSTEILRALLLSLVHLSVFKVFLAATSVLATYVTGKYLFMKDEEAMSVKYSFTWSPKKTTLSFFAVYCVSLFFVTTVHGTGLNEFFRDWSTLDFWMWARLLSSLAIIAFCPGYAFISIFCKTRRFGVAQYLSFSYLLSTLFNTVVFALTIFLLPNRSIVPLVIANVLVASIYALRNIPQIRGSETRFELRRKSLYEFLLVSLTLSFALVGLMSIALRSYPMRGGDQWIEHGEAIRFLKKTIDFSDLDRPYLYFVFIGSVMSLSGVPTINAFLTLLPLSLITFIAYYSMVSGLFSPRSKVPAVGTFFSTFLGFGWVYYVILSPAQSARALFPSLWDVSRKTFDIFYGSHQGLFPYIISHDWLFSTPVLFGLTYVFFTRNLSGRAKLVLTAALTALGFWMVVIPSVLAIWLFFIFSLFSIFDKHSYDSTQRHVSAGLLVGLLLMVTVDVFSPYSWLTQSFMQKVILMTTAVAIMSVVFTFVAHLRSRKQGDGHGWRSIMYLSFFLTVYLYGFSWVVLWYMWPALDSFDYYYGPFVSLPLFVLPLKFGIPLTLSLAYFFLVLYKEQSFTYGDKVMLLFATDVLCILIGLELYRTRIGALPIDESTISNYLYIPLSALAACLFDRLSCSSDTSARSDM